MAEKRTYVKRIIVGRPVKSINEAASGVVEGAGRQNGDILVMSPSDNLFKPGSLIAGHGLDKSTFDSSSNNIVMSLDSSELKQIIDSDYVKFITGQSLTRNFVDSSYVEANSLDSERSLNLLGALSTSIIPLNDSSIDLGSATKKFRKLFLSGQTIQLGALSISDSSGQFVVRDSDNATTKINLSANSTNDLKESDNLYYTRSRFDSALGDTTSRGTIRGYINLVDAGGDGSLTYDSAGGKITYTGPSAVEVRAHISAQDAGGDGSFSYNASTGVYTYTGPSAAETRAHINVIDAGGDGSFTYDSALGKLTYTGPNASEVRAHITGGHGVVFTSSTGVLSVDSSEVRGLFSASGDLTYNSGTGEFSIDVENVYTQANFESDLSLHLSATNGLTYDSNTHQLSIANTGVDSGTYGSSTRVPILTVNAQGQVDSAGSVLVAGVTGLTYDSATEKLTISTADGQTFATAIGGFNNLQADSANLFNVAGSNIHYDSGFIGQFSADSAHISTIDVTTLRSVSLDADSGVITSLSGTSLNFGSTQFADLLADSAKIGNVTVTGDLTVSGTQTTLNTQILKVTDPIIHLADSNINTDIVDLGFVGKYYRGGQQRHTGLIRDASNEQYYLFRDVVDSSLDSSATINRSATGFAKADLNVASLNADSSTLTNLTVSGISNISRAPTVDSGTYGSATLIPQITVNTSGFIDSIGTVAVASISSTTWDSSTGEYTISTADGGSFKTAIRGFGDNVSLAFGNENDAIISRNPTNLVIKDSTGGIYIEAQDIYLASKNNGNPIWLQVGADDGVKLNDSTGNLILKTRKYGVELNGSITGDSADFDIIRIGGKVIQSHIDSAYIELNSLDSERTINLIRNDALFVDSAYIEQNTLDSERTISLIDSSYVNLRAKSLTTDQFTVTLNDAGAAAGPTIVLDRNSSSAADSDAIAAIEFRGRNDAQEATLMSQIATFINDASDGTEDAELHFQVRQAGGIRTKMKLTPTGIVLSNSEKISFAGDSFSQILTPSNYTSNHTLTLPDSTGTVLTREHITSLVDSAYVGLRQGATGFNLNFDDSAGVTQVELAITQAATITTGAAIGFGNSVTLLDKDSAEVTISL